MRQYFYSRPEWCVYAGPCVVLRYCKAASNAVVVHTTYERIICLQTSDCSSVSRLTSCLGDVLSTSHHERTTEPTLNMTPMNAAAPATWGAGGKRPICNTLCATEPMLPTAAPIAADSSRRPISAERNYLMNTTRRSTPSFNPVCGRATGTLEEPRVGLEYIVAKCKCSK